ncbi:sce7725 family protein [Tenacibaculum sp.]|uniref:sce7725 family protein n=1 Tax=Tenacibaculum sp. TaxID=1906242 RepID=UPI003AA96896
MYFPFLRGKQFELIALREISGINGGYNYISPIIEPVKKKTATYDKTIKVLQGANANFTIIVNPHHGDIKNDIDYVCLNLLPPLAYDNFQLGIIVHSKTNLSYIAEKLNNNGLSKNPIVIILASVNDEGMGDLENFINTFNIKHIVLGSHVRERRTIIRVVKRLCDSLVTLSDPYNKLSRNKDYAIDTDEFFSEEHLYFSEEGYIGYSDFLTIGQEYTDKGYSPYAVAIHLTYSSSDDVFRVHHFVSDSNDDTSDVAGKFGEALDKLIPFINEIELHTLASNEFRDLNEEGKYPGLGTVKKLSILNHLELVNNYFS